MQDLKKKFRQAIATVVKNNRKKSITKSADEIGMGKSLWGDLENGIKDPQFLTLWRIAEGLEIKPHELACRLGFLPQQLYLSFHLTLFIKLQV